MQVVWFMIIALIYDLKFWRSWKEMFEIIEITFGVEVFAVKDYNPKTLHFLQMQFTIR